MSQEEFKVMMENLVAQEEKRLRVGSEDLSRKYRRYFEEYISAECCHHLSVESFQRTWMSEVEREVLGWS